MSSEAYDEELELDRYVNNHYRSLMTPFEVHGQKSAGPADKSCSTTIREVVRIRWDAETDPAVAAAHAQSFEAFRRAIRIRLMRDHAADITVNRCPKCQKVLRTPRAKRCLWCGHFWRPA